VPEPETRLSSSMRFIRPAWHYHEVSQQALRAQPDMRVKYLGV